MHTCIGYIRGTGFIRSANVCTRKRLKFNVLTAGGAKPLLWHWPLGSKSRQFLCVVGLLCCWAWWPKNTYATSLRISPVGLDLPLTQRAGAITLFNAGHEPVNLQLRAFAWSQVNNEEL